MTAQPEPRRSIVDAHQHFWTADLFDSARLSPQLEPLVHDFGPEDLRPALDEVGVDATILVQTKSSLVNTREFLAIADRYAWIVGVVGWVDLTSLTLEQTLDTLCQHPKLKGVRHQWEDEPDPGWLLRDDVLRGLRVLSRRGIPYDVLVKPPNWPYLPRVTESLPELNMVIDHIGKPSIRTRQFGDWSEMIRHAAEVPRMYCKLSGMTTEADWTSWQPADLRPYIDCVLEAFGPERVMFGSDWPVSVLAGSYAQVFRAIDKCTRGLSAPARNQVFGDTARAFYRVP